MLSPEDQATASREIDVLKKLTHPNIVEYVDSFKGTTILNYSF